MKCLIVLFCLGALISTGFSDRIVVHTSNQSGTLYNFFPLRTNVLHFSVKATNDIHISLTNTPMLTKAYYEIAIGGWANTKSVIRKDSGDSVVEYVGKVVNPDKFQSFWVAIDENEGSISVGKKAGDAFLYFKDPDFVKMSYFGISTGYGSSGEWNFDFDLFNCECCNQQPSTPHPVVTIV